MKKIKEGEIFMNQENEVKKQNSKVIGEIGPNGFRYFSNDEKTETTETVDKLEKTPDKKVGKQNASTKDKKGKKEYDLDSDFLFHHLLTLLLWFAYQIVLPVLIFLKVITFRFDEALVLGGICFFIWAVTFALRTFGTMGIVLLRTAFVVIASLHVFQCLSIIYTQIKLVVDALYMPVNYQQLGGWMILTIVEIVVFLMISNYYEKRKEFFY